MSTRSTACRSVFVLLVGALFWSFPPLAVSAQAEADKPAASFIRLEWLSDLGAESIAAGESTPPTGQDSLVAVAPGAVYSFGIDTDGSLRKLNKIAADSSIPYGAATSGDAVVLAASDGSLSLWSALEGLQWQMMQGNGLGMNWKGVYATSLLDHHANWRDRANELSLSLKIAMLTGEYFTTHYRGHFYAKCQNLGRQLTETYDAALADIDLLLMPTVPVKATPLPGPDAPGEEILQRAFEMLNNTCPFDVTGHPAMSVPCGMSDGLPIGMMLIGKKFDESSIYRAAHAFEQSADWTTM